VESLALGTPVVGYRRGCLPELVDEASTGLLVDPGDEDGLAARILAARALHPSACRRAAATRFAPSVMAENYLNLYQTVIQRAALRSASTKGPAQSPVLASSRRTPHLPLIKADAGGTAASTVIGSAVPRP
jgi:hypothetical protein